jgi:lipase maturation factor 1
MSRWVPRSTLQTGPLAGAGPAVARVFHGLLALHFLVAWASLGVQVLPLIGPEGLEPAVDHFARLSARPELGLLDAPSLFWLGASAPALVGGCVLGAGLAVAAAAGLAPRVLLPLSALLYLGYAHAAPTFLSFQWDNLLIEAGLLAALLPRDRPSAAAHLALRLLLFKVFFESGLAKWASPRGDWQDGSAMAAYYETAPLPTPLAALFHHLPGWWHTLESWWAVGFELAVPVAIFGGRRLRALALGVFATFLVVDFATANYGFFVPLTGALLLFLLDESHALAVLRLLRREPPPPAAAPGRWAPALTTVLVGAWIGLSALGGLARFADADLAPGLRRAATTWRVANTYHLFTSITTERLEPEFQTSRDGQTWTPHALHHKPGPADRRPPLVAPHQPRLDFQLWFYALRWQRSTPRYVVRLVEGLCHAPGRVQPFFDGPLPTDTRAVRIVFHDMRFTDGETRRATGRWWDRVEVGATRTLSCADVARSGRPAADAR